MLIRRVVFSSFRSTLSRSAKASETTTCFFWFLTDFATEIESYNQDSYQRALKADEAIRINIGENTESKRKEREIELRKAS